MQKERKPRQSGVRMMFQAFCRECNWTGAEFLGPESRHNAYDELRWHKKTAEANCSKCSKKYKALAALENEVSR